ncbi:hypothetical protein FKM82_018702 [Ascaphus truei]
MMTSSQSALSSSSGASSQRTSLSQMGESDLALQGFSQQLGNSDDEGAEEGSPESEKDSAAQQEEEEESELVVLDPDHPLMTRFQSALKQYLTKQIQALDIELREMSTSMKRHKSEREELGVSLYGIQQELARLQMSLEKQHDKHARVATLRRQKEDELETIRNLYKKTHQTTNAEHKTDRGGEPGPPPLLHAERKPGCALRHCGHETRGAEGRGREDSGGGGEAEAGSVCGPPDAGG